MTDADTVEQYLEAARLGDERAFERLYRETVGAVYGLCLRLTANPLLAEECVQQVYVQAWRNLHRFRREKKHAADPLDPLEDPAGSDDARTVDLERAIAALPDRARAVFVLVGIYGYSHEEAASMLGIATGTSKAHYHHARKQLRRHLEATP